MNSFLLALQFLTVAMVKKDLAAGPEEFVRCRAWFGLVGALLGCVLALAAWLLGLVLGQTALAAALVALWAGLTRMLHLDGVADVADALGNPIGKQRALEIMKDSRIGAFGVCAMVCVLLAKFAALSSLAPGLLVPALVAAPALGRAASGLLAGALPPATPGKGLGAAMAADEGLRYDFISAFSALAVALLVGGAAGAVAVLAAGCAAALLGRWFMKRLRGITGDTLGATIEVVETVVLMTFCAW